MAKQKIIAGHLDHKHGYYYMVLSQSSPEQLKRETESCRNGSQQEFPMMENDKRSVMPNEC